MPKMPGIYFHVQNTSRSHETIFMSKMLLNYFHFQNAMKIFTFPKFNEFNSLQIHVYAQIGGN